MMRKDIILRKDPKGCIAGNDCRTIFKKSTLQHIAIVVIISLLILLSSIAIADALSWSEVMFNPLGNDDGKEFIELLGNESLSGCRIFDSTSSDALLLLNQGNDVIMIVENASDYENNLLLYNNTVYVVGAAIGNGLGNTNETIKIVCVNGSSNNTLLEMSYDVNGFSGYKEGDSIFYCGNSDYGSSGKQGWVLGPANGTPGKISSSDHDLCSNANDSSSKEPSIQGNSTSKSSSGGGSGSVCLNSIHLFTTKTKAVPGEIVEIELLAPKYASVEAKDDKGNILLFKDTFEGSRFQLVVPNAKFIQLVAIGEACGATQRMRKTITIGTSNLTIAISNSSVIGFELKKNSSEEKIDRTNITDRSNVDTDLEKTVSIEEKTKTRTGADTAILANAVYDTRNTTPIIQNEAVYDKNASAVKWICGFGAIVIIVCGFIFFRLLKSGTL